MGNVMLQNQPPQPDAGALGQLNHVGTWIILVIMGLTGGAIATIKRAGSVSVAAYHIMLAAFIGPGGAIIAMNFFNANIYVACFISWLGGMMVFGIAVLLKVADKRIERIDIVSTVLPKTAIVTEEMPPPAPSLAPKSEDGK